MSESAKPEQGAITWIDMAVEHAVEIQKFYSAVVGWTAEPVSMGDYDDFNMTTPRSGHPNAGICHARGGNAGLPAQWLIYINVANLDHSIALCEELGGTILRPATSMGNMGRFCVIQDPAGAVAALFEPAGGVA